ncbi:hypothetical protein [Xenorhabdus anantnagensis]|uniref:Uncharacterized protein n=1 Tax=Xenorhabdus anantnagensis TaxID=3025875 RepID=A0ABT5LLQ5_9GAMM|nr:hypothetical protein [Xenorhabdus anantnagensis]MDC9595348.1 hypothetical protein [Xenorhabdus anantnagensis]
MYNNIHVEQVRNILDDILTSAQRATARLVILPSSHTESHRAFAC